MLFSIPGTEEGLYTDVSWDTPKEPAANALAVVCGKTVVLVRHHYSERGDVEKIFNEYIDEKVVGKSI